MRQPPINVQAYDELPEPLWSAAWALELASFPDPDESDEEREERMDRFPVYGDAFKWIVAVRDGEVVGLTVAFRRAIRFASWPVTLSGISDMCVTPEYRRQGIAKRLTVAVMDGLKSAGCDVAYLNAVLDEPGVPELYGRAGFRRLEHGHTYVGASGRRYLDHDGMIAPMRSRQPCAAILGQPEPFDIGQGNW